MKRWALAVLFFALLPVQTMAAGSGPAADTRYPVVLAHGMAASAEILGIIDYWWGIPEAMRDAGCEVYVTSVNGMDGTANKAADFKRQVLEILAASNAEKVNVIGHSHGTLYTRYAISNLGLGDKVASYTSIAGPHQGSAMADTIMYGIPEELHGLAGGTLDFLYTWVFGDKNPDSLENGWNLTTAYMKDVFNPNTPDVAGLYYQSWAAKAKWSCPNVILEPTWAIMLLKEGANDGLVGVESAKWGHFRGVEEAAWYSAGCDHLNIVGQLFGVTPGFDAPEFYVGIASELKEMGY